MNQIKQRCTGSSNKYSITISALIAAAALLSGCATAPPAPTTPQPFDTAIANATAAVFANSGFLAKQVVIDPMVDGVSGEQTTATRYIESKVRELARTKHTKFEVRDFKAENLAKKPLVMVGTLIGISADNRTVGKRLEYRICLALVDLSSNKIVGKGEARSTIDGIDTTRTAYFEDSPVWIKDAAVEAYIQTCGTAKVGDPADAVYVKNIDSAATIAEAITAYEGSKFAQALEGYQNAATLPSGNQMRVFAGVYLAQLRLGRVTEAEDAFGRIVDAGIATNRLAVKFLFQPGSVEFWSDTKISGSYPAWLRQIASRITKAEKCLQVVGHTSRSGADAFNDRLSLSRADAVKRRLQTVEAVLGVRTDTAGMGFRENVIGTGSDDLTDLQDRRVEFKLSACKK